jgi:hypothetical protein
MISRVISESKGLNVKILFSTYFLSNHISLVAIAYFRSFFSFNAPLFIPFNYSVYYILLSKYTSNDFISFSTHLGKQSTKTLLWDPSGSEVKFFKKKSTALKF